MDTHKNQGKVNPTNQQAESRPTEATTAANRFILAASSSESLLSLLLLLLLLELELLELELLLLLLLLRLLLRFFRLFFFLFGFHELLPSLFRLFYQVLDLFFLDS